LRIADQRRYIQETAALNGAEYHGDLTKSVTHLIAATPTGKKYEYALNWKMKVVSWEWFEQSLQRGMALEESYYDPKLPAEQRGKGAWERRVATSPTLGKRVRGPDDGLALNPLKRKLRRSASHKLGSQSQALWAGITAASLDRSIAENDDWTEENSTTVQPVEGEEPQPENETEDNALPPEESHSEAVARQDSWDDSLFQGRIIFTHMFDPTQVCCLYLPQGSRPSTPH